MACPYANEKSLLPCCSKRQRYIVNYNRQSDSIVFECLTNSAFASLLPFFPLFLQHNGLTVFEIGAIYGIGHLISCISAVVWFQAYTSGNSKKMIIMLSLFSWIAFITPFGFIDFNTEEKCSVLNTLNLNTTNVSIGHPVTSKIIKAEENFLIHKTLHGLNLFTGALLVLTTGRIFQSATDYYYFGHRFLLRTDITENNLSVFPQHVIETHIVTELPSALTTIGVALFMDHISATVSNCNQTIGGYKICFYVFTVLIMFAIMVLQFFDLMSDEEQLEEEDIAPEKGTESILSYITCIILYATIFVSSTICSYISTYLYVYMYDIGGTYLCIAAAYTSRCASKSFVMAIQHVITKYLTIFDVIILSLITTAALAFVAGSAASPLILWYMVAVELLSGLPILTQTIFESYLTPNWRRGKLAGLDKLTFVLYWMTGSSLGSFGGGYLAQKQGMEKTFFASSLVCLGATVVLMMTYVISVIFNKVMLTSRNDI